ncbi:hypothetical protein GQ43DRAFT_494825 [Delitschia confertaspora ATCC 74209]|uniref:Rhodopsin domain-containing protein n=1 Tax=Delitschia confertaspora ATCC 74209 TaxID=1513339 RepID=A0A9P4JEB6_9PLEO|nr:hypothetical protein GQ43DRAFT_494825 [Delitschia confertaspora ATCC 74209]
MSDRADEDAGASILGVTLMITSLALVTLVVRMYVQIKMISSVGWDDYIMILTMATVRCIAGQGVIIPEVYYGAGRHINHIPPEHVPLGLKYNYITQPIFLWAICFLKLSIGCFLLRIASTPFYRRTIIGVMAFMALYTFACFLTIVLQCSNIAMLWDSTIEGTCWGSKTLQGLSYTNVALNVTTDLLFAVAIPVPMLWNVQMNCRQKGSIVGILALGIFATAAAFVKISYLPNYGKAGDFLWDSRHITIWTVLECNVGIIGANLPCMKPLFRRVLGSTYGRGTSGKSKYFDGPYGRGTGHTGKQYSNLSSMKAHESGYPAPFPTSDEAHMMTNINARERSLGQESTEEETWYEQPTTLKMGGITKTTEVDVIRASGPERRPANIV